MRRFRILVVRVSYIKKEISRIQPQRGKRGAISRSPNRSPNMDEEPLTLNLISNKRLRISISYTLLRRKLEVAQWTVAKLKRKLNHFCFLALSSSFKRVTCKTMTHICNIFKNHITFWGSSFLALIWYVKKKRLWLKWLAATYFMLVIVCK